jgi:U4/U6 small nuclear ribonucleoprotein PRP4
MTVLLAVQFGEHTEAARRARRQQQEAVASAQQRRRMHTMVVPTDDKEVRTWLRKLAKPMTVFGERQMERRERLRGVMARLSPEQRDVLTERLMQLEVENCKAPTEKFFTEGPPELLQLRRCESTTYEWVASWTPCM